jgi:hypothetical protein
MNHPSISAEDWAKIGRIVEVAANGPFFDDGEFETLFGVTREFVREMAAAWPEVDVSDQNTLVGINNSILHIVTYPHGKRERLPSLIGLSVEQISTLFKVFRESRGSPLPTDYLSAFE